MKPTLNKEDFPFGEFGITEDSIITGVAGYVVGQGYGTFEYVRIIEQALDVYLNMGIIRKFAVHCHHGDKILSIAVLHDDIEDHKKKHCFYHKSDYKHKSGYEEDQKHLLKMYTFGPDGRPYKKRYHNPIPYYEVV